MRAAVLPAGSERARFLAAVRFVGACLMAMLAGACSVQSSHVMLDDQVPLLLPAGQEVQVFRTGRPDRPYVRVARLDVHVEKTFFSGASIEEALPLLQQEARYAGADAIVEIQERRSWWLETRIYQVTGIGIRFLDRTDTGGGRPPSGT